MKLNYLLSRRKDWLLALIFNLVLIQLLVGIIYTSGGRHLLFWCTAFCVFNITFLLCNKLLKNFKFSFELPKFPRLQSNSIAFLMAISILIALVDLIFFVRFPMLRAFSITSVKELIDLRANVNVGMPTLWIYVAGWNLKAVLPFLIFYSFRKKWYYCFAFLAIFSACYAFLLMQKSFCVVVLMPVIIWALLNKEWKIVLIGFALVGTSVFVITAHHNQVIKHDTTFVSIKTSEEKTSLLSGLINRILVIPGEVVSLWLDVVPEKEPYLLGKGYGWIAAFQNESYQNYDLKLYQYWKPSYAKQGIQGRVNTASFMREYSNFGWLGLFLGCMMISFVLSMIQSLFVNDWKSMLALMGMPIILLSSTNVMTIFFSGGGALTILLYVVYRSHWMKMKGEG